MRELWVNYGWARVFDEQLESPGALTGATGSASRALNPISFGSVFAIPGLLNGEAFRKLIAHGVCHLYSSALSDSVGGRKCFSCLEDTSKGPRPLWGSHRIALGWRQQRPNPFGTRIESLRVSANDAQTLLGLA